MDHRPGLDWAYGLMGYLLSSAAAWVLEEINNDENKPRRQYSQGRVHSAFCKNAWAKRQAESARKAVQLSADQSQNMVKAVFGKWARGRNLAASCNVCPGLSLYRTVLLGGKGAIGLWKCFDEPLVYFLH